MDVASADLCQKAAEFFGKRFVPGPAKGGRSLFGVSGSRGSPNPSGLMYPKTDPLRIGELIARIMLSGYQRHGAAMPCRKVESSTAIWPVKPRHNSPSSYCSTHSEVLKGVSGLQYCLGLSDFWLLLRHSRRHRMFAHYWEFPKIRGTLCL